MKAYIVLQCISGIGDQYTSMLSGYKVYEDLKALGYEVEVIWHVRNMYYPSDLPLDPLFDFSCFEGNISYNRESEIVNQYRIFPQTQNSFRIYLSEIVPELENYQSQVYGYSWFYRKTIIEQDYNFSFDSNKQFLSQEVLDKVERFRKGRTKMKGIHFRVQDTDIRSSYDQLINTPMYVDPAKMVENYILENKEDEIMLCSNNRAFVDKLTNIYPNAFQNSFTHDIPPYYANYPVYLTALTKASFDFIEHAQEIAAEMAMFKYCDQILTYSTFHSSYLSYGVLHNVHHLDWKTKIRNLIL